MEFNIGGILERNHACKPDHHRGGLIRRYDLLNNHSIQQFLNEKDWLDYRGHPFSDDRKYNVISTATTGLVRASELIHALHMRDQVQIQVHKQMEENGPFYNLYKMVTIPGLKNFLATQPLKYDMRELL